MWPSCRYLLSYARTSGPAAAWEARSEKSIMAEAAVGVIVAMACYR